MNHFRFALPSFPRLSFFLLLALCFALIPSLSAQETSKKSAPAKAYFAGGCFWCTEEIFQQTPGVLGVVSGYMSGAESIEITFDPAHTSYEKLLALFWRAHDPTEVDRQGPDVGKKYRSAIFFLDNQQREAALKSKANLEAARTYPKPIATEVSRATNFEPADAHHQNYCRKNPNDPYIQQWLVPKLRKLGMKP